MNPRMNLQVIAMIVVVMMMMGVRSLLGGMVMDMMGMHMDMVMSVDMEIRREMERERKEREAQMLMRGNRIIRGRVRGLVVDRVHMGMGGGDVRRGK